MPIDHHSLSDAVIGSAIEVHRVLGPGLLESAYEKCLCFELTNRDVSFRRQVQIPITYKSVNLDCGFRVDLLVAEALVVELKVVESLSRLHTAQLLTYLKLCHCRTGLLLNFNTSSLRHGIKRLVL